MAATRPFARSILGARRALVARVRAELVEAGFDDLPRTSALYLDHLERGPLPLSELVERARVPKQLASQVVDTLVTRGYAQRTADPDDRRRVTVALTPRGLAAAEVAREAAAALRDELVERVGPDRVADALEVLSALADLSVADPGRT